MKKIIIFLILLLAIMPTVVNANTIYSINMEIYIDNNGNAKITEEWHCNTNQGTESYHPYYNLGTSKIQNLQVIDEKGQIYQTLSDWNVNGSFSNKSYKCGLNYLTDGVEICWGISEYGEKTYTVGYEITDFVSSLTDSQMVYWTLIPHEFSNTIGKADIEIKSDFAYEDTLDVWGYGNYGGLCYVSDGTIKMSTDGKKLSSDEYMTILVKFPEGTFDAENKIDENFEYYLNMAEEGAQQSQEDPDRGIMMFLNTIGVLEIIIVISFIFLFIRSLKRSSISKEDKNKINEAEYYREIPCEKDLFKAYYIASTYGIIDDKKDFLGAIFLKWLKEGKISIIKRNVGIFNKEEECIKFNLTDSEIEDIIPKQIPKKKKTLSEEETKEFIDNFIRERKAVPTDEIYFDLEEKLLRYTVQASQDGILEKKELEKWCQKNYSIILNWFERVIMNEENKLIRVGDIEIEDDEKTLKSQKIIYSNNILNEAIKLSGLKKYLKDYTLIHDREAIEVELFEEYLIYAQMFGIAKKVMKEFKDLYPDVIEQSNFKSFDNINLLMICAYSGINNASSARASAYSYSSGGGGFSSGGGRRRFIWWWRRPEEVFAKPMK